MWKNYGKFQMISLHWKLLTLEFLSFTSGIRTSVWNRNISLKLAWNIANKGKLWETFGQGNERNQVTLKRTGPELREICLPFQLLFIVCLGGLYLMQWGFPGGASGKEPACQCRRCEMRVQSMGWKIPWRRAWKSWVFLLGESHRQRSLVKYSP